MKSDEIWWNLMKPDEIWWNHDFIRFHQISSDVIRCHQILFFSFFLSSTIFFLHLFFGHPDQSITKCVLRKQMVHQKHFRVTHFGFQSFSSRAHCWFQHPFIKGYAKKCLSMQWVVFVFVCNSLNCFSMNQGGWFLLKQIWLYICDCYKLMLENGYPIYHMTFFKTTCV